MRNTYKYTRLYSGENPIFEERDVFRTMIPLKKIATQKFGGENVSQDVSRMSSEEIKCKIIDMIQKNNYVSRKYMADTLWISEKTITRYIKNIPKYSICWKREKWTLGS